MSAVWRRWARALPAGALGAGFASYGWPASCEPSSSPKLGKPDLIRISYTSAMRGDVKKAAQNVETIVEKSVKQNLQLKLSGQLCYDAKAKHVWQVLEGDRAVVQALWELIASDARHVVDDDTVSVEPITSRKYPTGWGLRYAKFQQDDDGGLRAVDVVNSELMQIAYKSFIEDQGGREKEEMDEIVPRAMIKNAKFGVTGWLLFNIRTLTVYQILEGPPESVERIWEAINQDPRHQVCAASVKRRVVEKREYPTWSMTQDTVEPSIWSQQSY